MAATMKFDTHSEFKTYKKAGFTEDQADALLEVQTYSIENYVASKNDIVLLRKDTEILSKDMDMLREEMEMLHKDMEMLRKNVDMLRKDMDTLRKDMDTLRKDMEILIDLKISEAKTDIIKWMAGMLAAHTAIVIAAVGLMFIGFM